MSGKRVLVVGLDGATFDLARPWIDEGRLPNLARLVTEGASGELASTIPPISAAAWSSFATGVNPGKHGIYHFRQHVSGSYRQRIANGGDRRRRSLWRILSDLGKRVVVVNVVMTYPPEPVNGCLVAGLDAPGTGSNYTYPTELRDELHRAVPGYVIEPDLNQYARRGQYDAVYDNIISCLETREAAIKHLLDGYRYDFFAVNFRATDVVQHHFWKFIDESHPLYVEKEAAQYGHCIREVYERLDRIVGDLAALCDSDTTMVVMSDHGFGSDSSHTIYINRWLEAQGWLSFSDTPGDHGRTRRLRGRLERGAREVLRQLVLRVGRQHAPQGIKDGLKRRLPGLANTLKSPDTYHAVDWSRTVAYSDEHRSNVWLNLRGREPQGTVEPGEEYEALRDAIIERLAGLQDPETGVPVVERAYRREELYPGPNQETTPDIHMVLSQNPLYVSRSSGSARGPGCVVNLSAKQLSAEWLISGRHRPNGILVMKGQGIKKNIALEGTSILDLAPTILALMDCPVPESMDGRVIQEAFVSPPMVKYESDRSCEETAPTGQAYTDDEVERVEDKLRGLGYI